MNRDQKIALFLAPFLLVGGYVASDFYLESKDNETRLFTLQHQGECQMFSGNCILHSGDMQINITDSNGITTGNTAYPVDSVAVSLVYSDGREVIYGLEKDKNPQYWSRETDIGKAFREEKSADRLRLVIRRKGSTYLSEFIPTSTNP
jgi:hypothetical protein